MLTAIGQIHPITPDIKGVEKPSSCSLYVKQEMVEKEAQQRGKVTGRLVALEVTVSSMSPYF
jgi:hypothetical protein